MNEYSIYCMRGSDGSFYYGSTANSRKNRVQRRFQLHKATAKTVKNKLYDHFNTIGWNNVTVEEIAVFTGSKQDQLLRENEYIKPHLENSLCLNSHQGGLTEEERKQSKRNAQKKYHWANRQARNDRYYLYRYGMTQAEWLAQ